MKGNGGELHLELDASMARIVEHLARAWGVSKQQALRRALEQAEAASGLINKQGRLEAFKELQRRLELTPAKAAEWQAAVREGRR